MFNPAELLSEAWSALALYALFWGMPTMLVLGLPWIRKSWAPAFCRKYPWVVFLGTWLTWACWLFLPAHWIVATVPTGDPTGRIRETMCFPPHGQAFSVATALALMPAIAHALWLLRDPSLQRGRRWLSALFWGVPLLPALLSFSLALSVVVMDLTGDGDVKSGALDEETYQGTASPSAPPDAK